MKTNDISNSNRSVLIQTTLRVSKVGEDIEIVSDRGIQTIASIIPTHDNQSFIPFLEFTPYSEIVKDSQKVIDLPRKAALQFNFEGKTPRKSLSDFNPKSALKKSLSNTTLLIDSDLLLASQHTVAMAKAQEEREIQTDLTVNPYILDEDTVANVCAQLAVQTSITFEPTDSLTEITKSLKRAIRHTKTFQAVVVDGKYLTDYVDDDASRVTVSERLSAENAIEDVTSNVSVKIPKNYEEDNKTSTNPEDRSPTKTVKHTIQTAPMNMTEEEFEANVQRILDQTVSNVYEFMAKIVEMYEQSKDGEGKYVETPLSKELRKKTMDPTKLFATVDEGDEEGNLSEEPAIKEESGLLEKPPPLVRSEATEESANQDLLEPQTPVPKRQPSALETVTGLIRGPKWFVQQTLNVDVKTGLPTPGKKIDRDETVNMGEEFVFDTSTVVIEFVPIDIEEAEKHFTPIKQSQAAEEVVQGQLEDTSKDENQDKQETPPPLEQETSADQEKPTVEKVGDEDVPLSTEAEEQKAPDDDETVTDVTVQEKPKDDETAGDATVQEKPKDDETGADVTLEEKPIDDETGADVTVEEKPIVDEIAAEAPEGQDAVGADEQPPAESDNEIERPGTPPPSLIDISESMGDSKKKPLPDIPCECSRIHEAGAAPPSISQPSTRPDASIKFEVTVLNDTRGRRADAEGVIVQASVSRPDQDYAPCKDMNINFSVTVGGQTFTPGEQLAIEGLSEKEAASCICEEENEKQTLQEKETDSCTCEEEDEKEKADVEESQVPEDIEECTCPEQPTEEIDENKAPTEEPEVQPPDNLEPEKENEREDEVPTEPPKEEVEPPTEAQPDVSMKSSAGNVSSKECKCETSVNKISTNVETQTETEDGSHHKGETSTKPSVASSFVVCTCTESETQSKTNVGELPKEKVSKSFVECACVESEIQGSTNVEERPVVVGKPEDSKQPSEVEMRPPTAYSEVPSSGVCTCGHPNTTNTKSSGIGSEKQSKVTIVLPPSSKPSGDQVIGKPEDSKKPSEVEIGPPTEYLEQSELSVKETSKKESQKNRPSVGDFVECSCRNARSPSPPKKTLKQESKSTSAIKKTVCICEDKMKTKESQEFLPCGCRKQRPISPVQKPVCSCLEKAKPAPKESLEFLECGCRKQRPASPVKEPVCTCVDNVKPIPKESQELLECGCKKQRTASPVKRPVCTCADNIKPVPKDSFGEFLECSCKRKRPPSPIKKPVCACTDNIKPVPKESQEFLECVCKSQRPPPPVTKPVCTCADNVKPVPKESQEIMECSCKKVHPPSPPKEPSCSCKSQKDDAPYEPIKLPPPAQKICSCQTEQFPVQPPAEVEMFQSLPTKPQTSAHAETCMDGESKGPCKQQSAPIRVTDSFPKAVDQRYSLPSQNVSTDHDTPEPSTQKDICVCPQVGKYDESIEEYIKKLISESITAKDPELIQTHAACIGPFLQKFAGKLGQQVEGISGRPIKCTGDAEQQCSCSVEVLYINDGSRPSDTAEKACTCAIPKEQLEKRQEQIEPAAAKSCHCDLDNEPSPNLECMYEEDNDYSEMYMEELQGGDGFRLEKIESDKVTCECPDELPPVLVETDKCTSNIEIPWLSITLPPPGTIVIKPIREIKKKRCDCWELDLKDSVLSATEPPEDRKVLEQKPSPPPKSPSKQSTQSKSSSKKSPPTSPKSPSKQSTPPKTPSNQSKPTDEIEPPVPSNEVTPPEVTESPEPPSEIPVTVPEEPEQPEVPSEDSENQAPLPEESEQQEPPPEESEKQEPLPEESEKQERPLIEPEQPEPPPEESEQPEPPPGVSEQPEPPPGESEQPEPPPQEGEKTEPPPDESEQPEPPVEGQPPEPPSEEVEESSEASEPPDKPSKPTRPPKPGDSSSSGCSCTDVEADECADGQLGDMQFVYDNPCYSNCEPYMDPVYKLYPDDCDTYCGPFTEIHWSDILIPKKVKLRAAKKPKPPPPPPPEVGSSPDKGAEGGGRALSQGETDRPPKGGPQTGDYAPASEFEIDIGFTQIASTFIKVEGGADSQQTVSEMSSISDVRMQIKRCPKDYGVTLYMPTVGSQPFIVTDTGMEKISGLMVAVEPFHGTVERQPNTQADIKLDKLPKSASMPNMSVPTLNSAEFRNMYPRAMERPVAADYYRPTQTKDKDEEKVLAIEDLTVSTSLKQSEITKPTDTGAFDTKKPGSLSCNRCRRNVPEKPDPEKITIEEEPKSEEEPTVVPETKQPGTDVIPSEASYTCYPCKNYISSQPNGVPPEIVPRDGNLSTYTVKSDDFRKKHGIPPPTYEDPQCAGLDTCAMPYMEERVSNVSAMMAQNREMTIRESTSSPGVKKRETAAMGFYPKTEQKGFIPFKPPESALIEAGGEKKVCKATCEAKLKGEQKPEEKVIEPGEHKKKPCAATCAKKHEEASKPPESVPPQKELSKIVSEPRKSPCTGPCAHVPRDIINIQEITNKEMKSINEEIENIKRKLQDMHIPELDNWRNPLLNMRDKPQTQLYEQPPFSHPAHFAVPQAHFPQAPCMAPIYPPMPFPNQYPCGIHAPDYSLYSTAPAPYSYPYLQSDGTEDAADYMCSCSSKRPVTRRKKKKKKRHSSQSTLSDISSISSRGSKSSRGSRSSKSSRGSASLKGRRKRRHSSQSSISRASSISGGSRSSRVSTSAKDLSSYRRKSEKSTSQVSFQDAGCSGSTQTDTEPEVEIRLGKGPPVIKTKQNFRGLVSKDPNKNKFRVAVKLSPSKLRLLRKQDDSDGSSVYSQRCCREA